MAKKITMAQYKKAKLIICQWQKENEKTFKKGFFSKNDLTIMSGSITVEKLTEDIFSDDNCAELEQLILEKTPDLRWCNVDDSGVLSIAFENLIVDKYVDIVLESLNAL